MGQDDISLATCVIHDHYMTDLPLLFPPHVVAVTAIFLAMTLKPTQVSLQAAADSVSALSGATAAPKDSPAVTPGPSSSQQKKVQHLVSWLAKSEIDIKAVVECCQEIISFYAVWEQYSEKECKEQINRFLKVKGIDK